MIVRYSRELTSERGERGGCQGRNSPKLSVVKCGMGWSQYQFLVQRKRLAAYSLSRAKNKEVLVKLCFYHEQEGKSINKCQSGLSIEHSGSEAVCATEIFARIHIDRFIFSRWGSILYGSGSITGLYLKAPLFMKLSQQPMISLGIHTEITSEDKDEVRVCDKLSLQPCGRFS